MKKLVIILTMLAALLISSCSKSSLAYETSEDRVMFTRNESSKLAAGFQRSGDMSIQYDEISVEEEIGSDHDSAILNEAERKLVKTANIRIRVENLDSANSYITDMMNKYNGYAALTEFEDNSRFYSLRIPSDRYDIFISELDGIGRLLHRSENIEDVTINYYDLEGRLESKKELLKTFQTYLGKATNMEEILSVEKRIAELQYDIDFTGSQLRNLSNRIDYATISLYLLGPVTQTVYKGDTFGEKVKQIFKSFGNFLSSLVVFILGFIIYGIPIIGLLILLVWLLFGKVGLLKKLWQLVMIKKE